MAACIICGREECKVSSDRRFKHPFCSPYCVRCGRLPVGLFSDLAKVSEALSMVYDPKLKSLLTNAFKKYKKKKRLNF